MGRIKSEVNGMDMITKILYKKNQAIKINDLYSVLLTLFSNNHSKAAGSIGGAVAHDYIKPIKILGIEYYLCMRDAKAV